MLGADTDADLLAVNARSFSSWQVFAFVLRSHLLSCPTFIHIEKRRFWYIASLRCAAGGRRLGSRKMTPRADCSDRYERRTKRKFAIRALDEARRLAANTKASEAGASKSSAMPNVATTTTNSTASAGAKAYALLNQVMARDFRGESHFAQAATALSASSQAAGQPPY
jgi:hypothetical protein